MAKDGVINFQIYNIDEATKKVERLNALLQEAQALITSLNETEIEISLRKDYMS